MRFQELFFILMREKMLNITTLIFQQIEFKQVKIINIQANS